MKKRIIIALMLAITLLIGTAAPAMAARSGSWKVNKKAGSYLTSSEKTIFKKAVKKLTGASYTPVFRLAKQTVAGTNYAFLCTSSANAWKVLIVNKNLKGKYKLIQINGFKISKLKTLKNPYAKPNGDGAWEYNSKEVVSDGLPSAAKKAFKKAVKGYGGVSLTPLALLGTQVVAGTNYKFLCRGETVTAKPLVCLYEVNVYKDLSGACKITDCNVLNLAKYLAY